MSDHPSPIEGAASTRRLHATTQEKRTTLVVALIVFASGAAGLGYEVIWTRMLAAALGHEIVAVLAVLAAFFAGLSLGAYLLGDRWRDEVRPWRWYVGLEILIAGWAALIPWVVPWFNLQLPVWIGEQPSSWLHWSVAFGATLLLLLPATLAMGATLPVLERIYRAWFGRQPHVGRLYAANTLGAVAGALITTFILASALGYRLTIWLFALVNLGCAAGMFYLGRQAPDGQPTSTDSSSTHVSVTWLVTLFVTGLLGIGYEVLVIRVLSQVLEDTIFTFALILSVYLFATALGAAIYQRWLAVNSSEQTLSKLLIITSCTVVSGILALAGADAAFDWLIGVLTHTPVTMMASEIMLAMTVFFLPALSMGMLFSHLAQHALPRFGLGKALAINTLGAALAPLLAGVLLLPAIGAKFALLAVALGYLLLLGDNIRNTWRLASVPAVCIAALVYMPPLRFVGVPPGGHLLDYRDGVMASVAVVDDSYGARHLKVNNHFAMGSTSSFFADHRQTHLPLLLHGHARSALFLGVGTGMSLNAAQYHPQLQVTAVELVPENIDLMQYFGTAPEQNQWLEPPRLVPSDARRYVVSTQSRFDVIVADLFHPSRDGAGSLYTREHFEAIRQRLAPGGLFCQWLPLFQMDLDTFKLIARTFLDRFPHVQVHIPHYSLRQPIVGLIGSAQPMQYASGWLESNVHAVRLQQQLVTLRLNSDFALFGGFIATRRALQQYVGEGDLNTDDRPLVTYRAPRFAYSQQQGHGERLVRLVEALSHDRGSLLSASEEAHHPVFARRIDAYWQARDAYLRAGLGVEPSDDIRIMLGKIQAPLLEVVRISEDFTSAYFPLLSMANALNEIDPGAAKRLLSDLQAAAPSRIEAQELYKKLYN